MVALYKNPIVLSILYGIGTALITYLTPYSGSMAYVGLIVMLINLIDSHITNPNQTLSTDAMQAFSDLIILVRDAMAAKAKPPAPPPQPPAPTPSSASQTAAATQTATSATGNPTNMTLVAALKQIGYKVFASPNMPDGLVYGQGSPAGFTYYDSTGNPLGATAPAATATTSL